MEVTTQSSTMSTLELLAPPPPPPPSKKKNHIKHSPTGRYHNTSSVSSMIDHLNLESLEQRRQKARVIILYKIIHNDVDINPQSYLKKQERTTQSAHPYQFQTYSPTTDYFKYSFFPQTVCIWNSLPNSTCMVVSGQSLDQFKTLIQGYKF